MNRFKNKNLSLSFIGFLQALGLFLYCGLVGLLFWQAERWFGKMANFWGPLLLLTLLVFSALFCALIGFGYPFVLFWEKKQTIKALRLVIYTSAWLAFFVLLLIILLAVR